jgi:hypothetical protein
LKIKCPTRLTRPTRPTQKPIAKSNAPIKPTNTTRKVDSNEQIQEIQNDRHLVQVQRERRLRGLNHWGKIAFKVKGHNGDVNAACAATDIAVITNKRASYSLMPQILLEHKASEFLDIRCGKPI